MDAKIDTLTSEAENRLKKCSYFDGGFCRDQFNCKFYHPEETCKIHIKEGICNLLNCNYRHPKTCKYWLKNNCYRGESCVYSHIKTETDDDIEKMDINSVDTCNLENNCDRCSQKTKRHYYCEYCKRDFCSACIIKDVPKIEGIEINDLAGCNLIHEPVENPIEIVNEDTGKTTCKCGQSSNEIFKCEECKISFCFSCPSGPIKGLNESLHCLECLLSETESFSVTEIITSTPKKNYQEKLLTKTMNVKSAKKFA